MKASSKCYPAILRALSPKWKGWRIQETHLGKPREGEKCLRTIPEIILLMLMLLEACINFPVPMIQNSFSYLRGNISLFKCFLLVIFVSGCISQNKSPFESLKEKDVKYVIIEKY